MAMASASSSLLTPTLFIPSSRSQTLRSPLLSLPALPPLGTSLSVVYCGRGDRKTAKGKRFNHSFGNARPRDKKKGRGPPRIPVPSSPASPSPKRDRFENDEVVQIDIDESLC